MNKKSYRYFILFSLACIFAAFPAMSDAETFILKDEARLEGEILGKSDGKIFIKTKYGNLTLNEADVLKIEKNDSENKANDVNNAIIEETGIEVINSKDLEDPSARYVFSTVVAEDNSSKIFYFRDTEIIATETYDKQARLVNITGHIPDRTFTEYYSNGKVKSVKNMKNGKADGNVFSYYPDGTRQISAVYKNGMKNGIFSFFNPKGNPWIKAEYKDDKLNGRKIEYDENGKIVKTTWYSNDIEVNGPEYAAANNVPADAVAKTDNADISLSTAAATFTPSVETASAPGIANAVDNAENNVPAASGQAEEPVTKTDSNASKQRDGYAMSVKARKVARGTIYSFYLNNRYVGKSRLDKDYNVFMTDGKIPDGIARLYGKNDILQIEFIFRNKEIKNIIVYDEKGEESAQYSINEKGMAVKLGI